MSQYRTGTATVVQGSPVVSGIGTAWLDNVKPGDSFVMAGVGRVYDVASVDGNEQITLTAPYQGADRTGEYAIQRDFTTDGIPEMSQGDIETAAIFTRAMRKIQALLGQTGAVAGTGAGVYADTAAGLVATSDQEFFWVPGAEAMTLYQNDGGAAVGTGQYPNSTTLQAAVDHMNAMEGRLLNVIASLHPELAESTVYLDFTTEAFVVQEN